MFSLRIKCHIVNKVYHLLNKSCYTALLRDSSGSNGIPVGIS